MATRTSAPVLAAFFAIIVSFAVNSVITRYLVSGGLVGPFQLTLIRFLSGLVTLQLMTSVIPRSFGRTKASARDFVGAFFLGLYAFSISFGYFFIPAGAGALVFYSMVVITMSAYSVFKDGEVLSARLVTGELLGIIGIVVVTFSGFGSASLQGVALMVLTGASWGLYSVYGRRSGSYFGYTYNSFLFLGTVCVGLVLIATPLAGIGQWTGITTASLSLALFMGMVSTALSYVVWNRLLRKVSASQGGLAQLLVPVLTAFLGFLLLSERITATLAIGGGLILAGIYLNGSRNIGAKSAAPPS